MTIPIHLPASDVSSSACSAFGGHDKPLHHAVFHHPAWIRRLCPFPDQARPLSKIIQNFTGEAK
jgi:hypothetical protein